MVVAGLGLATFAMAPAAIIASNLSHDESGSDHRVVRWNGTSLQDLKAPNLGPLSVANGLLVCGDDVYVSGGYSDSPEGGVTDGFVQRLRGGKWTTLKTPGRAELPRDSWCRGCWSRREHARVAPSRTGRAPFQPSIAIAGATLAEPMPRSARPSRNRTLPLSTVPDSAPQICRVISDLVSMPSTV